MTETITRLEEPLANHVWFAIGGEAAILVPESKDALVSAIDECRQRGRSYRLIGNGSNVLVSDDGLDEVVIKTTRACDELSIEGNTVTAGASIMLPQLANVAVAHDLGGLEYLYSVPGTVGGGVFMNAGRGAHVGETISDHLVAVEIYDGTQRRVVPVDELAFDHRYSTFQEHEEWAILSATFELPSQPSSIGREKIRARMRHIENRERGKPNAGSVFKSGYVLPLTGLRIGDARYAHANRICNEGDATFDDVVRLIDLTVRLHRLVPFLQTPELEVRIWE